MIFGFIFYLLVNIKVVPNLTLKEFIQTTLKKLKVSLPVFLTFSKGNCKEV